MQYLHLDNWLDLPQLKQLQDLPKPPKTLYIRGKLNPEIFSNCVAVVGSRRMTDYGRQVIERLIPQLVFEGKTIVSGFMYGVDQYAHRVCVESDGKTIAVLGWGIKIPLDSNEETLANKIVQTGGILMSEWETQPSTLWTFPVRNRIVAGLCSDVYIIEAAVKSGSLLTAEQAQKLKRRVWAVPGPVTSRISAGTNRLIAEGKAKIWFGNVNQSQPVATNNPLLKLLRDESLTVNEIARKLSQSVSIVGAQLSLLTVTGQLVEREGKYYLNNAG